MSFSVQEVAQLLKQAKENEKPYVFFTGAGCSIKADVPSATGLIKEICEKFPIQVKKLDPDRDKFNYGKYMSALDKAERRLLLKTHIIDNKKINWAHIALACLIQAGYVQRVLTFNFDSILSRACSLLGLHPSIYDFATANPHLYHLINDPSIVHLHGQGTGFVQLNTEEETEQHTKKLGEFVAATLNNNPSLFIGYSGNADAFFPLLEEKYSEQHRLIWTGTKNTIKELESESVKNFLNKNNNLTHYIGNINADHFLVQLAKEVDCFPPELFSNPYKFLKQQLKVVQPYPLGDGLDILENLSEYLEQKSKEPLIETLYTSFIHKYPNKESTKHLEEFEVDQIMWAYNKQARQLYDIKKESECFELYERALKIKNNHIGCCCNYALNLSNFGSNKNDITFLQKAITILNLVFSASTTNSQIIITKANILSSIGKITLNDEHFKEAFDLLDNVITKNPQDLQAIHQYSVSLIDLGDIKNELEYFEKALSFMDTYLLISPNDLDTLTNRSTVLIALSRLTNDKEILKKTFENISHVIRLDPNEIYNLACYYSITNQPNLVKDCLFDAEENNKLPVNPFTHLRNDKDLNNVRNESWFIELLDRLKPKDEKENLDKVS